MKPTASLVSTVHHSMVADVFNVLSTSRSENIPDSAETNELSVLVERTGMLDYTQEPLVSIDTNDIDSGDLPTTIDIRDTINNTSEPGADNEDTDDTNYQSDLKSLSNLKKYKINMLRTQNLKEVGWSKLGDNIEEDRRWTKLTENREREQIQDAVSYYINNQKKRRE